jgi:predicted aminopeptidase
VLLAESGGDLEAFYARCEELAALDAAAREERLDRLLASVGDLQAARDPR